MADSTPVLVTGAAGAIGRVAVAGLRAQGWRVRGFDRVDRPGDPDHRVGDLADADAVRAAVAGCRQVVHLGAVPDRAPFVEELVPANVVGSYQVLAAARDAGVERVLLASTLRVSSLLHREREFCDGGRCYAVSDEYALSKVMVEETGRLFASRDGLTVIAMRIGWYLRDGEEHRSMAERDLGAMYLSPDDSVRFLVAALTAAVTGFRAYYVFSAGADPARWDLAAPARELGYQARDHFPAGSPGG